MGCRLLGDQDIAWTNADSMEIWTHSNNFNWNLDKNISLFF